MADGVPGIGIFDVGVLGAVAACLGLVLFGWPPTPLSLLLVLLEVRTRLSEALWLLVSLGVLGGDGPRVPDGDVTAGVFCD